jgi:hypothetical protein
VPPVEHEHDVFLAAELRQRDVATVLGLRVKSGATLPMETRPVSSGARFIPSAGPRRSRC